MNAYKRKSASNDPEKRLGGKRKSEQDVKTTSNEA